MYRLSALCCFRHLLGSQHWGSWRTGALLSNGYFNLKFKSKAQASSPQISFSHNHPFLGWWKLPFIGLGENESSLTIFWISYIQSVRKVCQFYWGKNLETNGSLHLCHHPALSYPTTVMASWPNPSFCPCFTICLKHSSQMLPSQILSFCSFRWSLLWMDAHVHQSGRGGPNDGSSNHTILQTTLAPPLGALASAFSIAGILFL